MKVVILHQHFKTPETGGAIRSWYLAKALIENGVSVAIVTAHNEGKFEKKTVDGIEVYYLPIAYDNKFGFVARGLSFLRFIGESVRITGEIPGIELIYAISVPLTIGIAAMRLKRKLNVPFVFEVGDLWPDAPVQLGFLRNYFLRRYLYALEKKIYRGATEVVALSPAIRDAILEKVPGKAVHMIPNMADCFFYFPEEKMPILQKQFGTDGKFVVSYIGAAGFANGLNYFLECANISRKQNLPIHFILCGEGAVRDRLKLFSDRLGLQNISFVDFQNREGVRKVMNVTDAVFVCYKNVPILETGSPNKFFDGLAAGKMIVVNFGGWSRKEIEENNCGIYVDPQQPTDFANRIRVFLDDHGKLAQYQQSARMLAETKYSRAKLSEEFVAVVTKLRRA